jgi:hypothetical protein
VFAKLALALLLLVPTATSKASLGGWTDSQCLATALHYEARGEPLVGRRAVLDTITNRMLATGKSACSIVLARGQFAWSKRRPLLAYGNDQRAMLGEVLKHPKVLNSEKYTYFFSGAKPVWAYNMSCRKIHGHNFCKGAVNTSAWAKNI